mgnify:CR=1 FL=1
MGKILFRCFIVFFFSFKLCLSSSVQSFAKNLLDVLFTNFNLSGKKLKLHSDVAWWYFRCNSTYQFQSASIAFLYYLQILK